MPGGGKRDRSGPLTPNGYPCLCYLWGANIPSASGVYPLSYLGQFRGNRPPPEVPFESSMIRLTLCVIVRCSTAWTGVAQRRLIAKGGQSSLSCAAHQVEKHLARHIAVRFLDA